MSESGKDRFILTKSYEIAYALFRVAGSLQERDFSERLRAAAGGLLEAAAVEDHPGSRRSLQAIEILVKFAGDVNLMTPTNTDIMLREVYVLDAAVVGRANAAKAATLDLAEIFSREPPSGTAVAADPAVVAGSKDFDNAATYPATESGNPAMEHDPATAESSNPSFLRAEIRQSAILDRIRQSGNCRIKDILEVLPGTSERTVRYDLQSLLEKNLIERMGNGGPSVAYRMRQSAPETRG